MIAASQLRVQIRQQDQSEATDRRHARASDDTLVAAASGVPEDTVRGRLRRFRTSAGRVREFFTRLAGALSPDPVPLARRAASWGMRWWRSPRPGPRRRPVARACGVGLGAGRATKLVVPPGIIGAAIESSGRSVLTPIDVQAIYNPATDQAGTNLELVFTQIVAASASKRPSPTVIVFLCGSIAQHPDLLNYRLQPVRWKSPTSPDGVVQSSTFGFLSQCVYTTLPMRIVGPPGEYRQALLTGSSGTAPTDTSSGTKVLYALPGIANWSFPVPIDGLTPTAMPRDSTLTVNLSQDPTDFENTFASPQLPDAGSLTWKSKIDVYAPPVVEYRLKADSLTAVSRLQLHLFIAGALVGVAGGAFMWFVQLVGQAGYGAAALRAKRTKAAVDQGSNSATAEYEVPGPAARTSSEPEGAGPDLRR